MAHSRIGIFAPYTWDESTQMACIVGDLLKQCAYPVTYVAGQSHDSPINFRWDHVIRSSRRLTSFKKWAYDCSLIIWFDVHKNKVQEAKACGTRNVIVPLWHRLSPAKWSMLREFDSVVCPSTGVFDLCSTQLLRNCQLAPWVSGLPVTRKTGGFVNPKQTRLYISVDGATVRQLDSLLFSVLHLLIDTHYDLHITISHTKQWSRVATSQASTLMKLSGGRVQLLRKPSHADRMAALRDHDWLFCPALTPNSGVDALEALSLGVPVIAFDLPPFNEFIQPGYNGALIKCDTTRSDVGAICGQPNTHRMYEALSSIFYDKNHFIRLQDTAWPDIESRGRSFYQIWRNVLG